MSLRDLRDLVAASSPGLSVAALLIAIVVFVAVVALLLRPASRRHFERARMMPLDDGPRAPSGEQGRAGLEESAGERGARS